LIYRIIDLTGNFCDPNFSTVSIIALAVGYAASEIMAPSEYMEYSKKEAERLKCRQEWFRRLAYILCGVSAVYLIAYMALYSDSRQWHWIINSGFAIIVILLVVGMLVLLIFRVCEPIPSIEMSESEYEDHFNKMGKP